MLLLRAAGAALSGGRAAEHAAPGRGLWLQRLRLVAPPGAFVLGQISLCFIAALSLTQRSLAAQCVLSALQLNNETVSSKFETHAICFLGLC